MLLLHKKDGADLVQGILGSVKTLSSRYSRFIDVLFARGRGLASEFRRREKALYMNEQLNFAPYFPVSDHHIDYLLGKVTTSEESATRIRDFSESVDRFVRCVGNRRWRFLADYTPNDGGHGASSMTGSPLNGNG